MTHAKPHGRFASSFAMLALLAVLGLAGCASPGASTAPRAGTSPHEEAGAVIYRRACGECHGLYAPTRYSDLEWRGIVPDMAREAHLSGEDTARVLTFLLAAN